MTTLFLLLFVIFEYVIVIYLFLVIHHNDASKFGESGKKRVVLTLVIHQACSRGCLLAYQHIGDIAL